MADLVALAAELTNDPLGRGYNGAGSENAGPGPMTDAQAATSLNAVNRPADVVAKDVIKYLALANKWGALSDGARNDVAVPKRIRARNFVDIVNVFEDFDLTDIQVLTVVTARLDELISDGFIDAGDKAAILAMGDNKQSRAQELGIGRVREGEVTMARTV